MRSLAPPLILLAATAVAAAAEPTTPPSAFAPSPVTPAAGADDVLLRSAWVWEARRRGDLARQSLEKLLRARPGDLRVMLEIGLVDLRSGRINEAKSMLETMRSRAPGNAATRELETAHRLASRDRLQLASLNRLLELERFDEAAVLLQKLFPDGPPGHTLGIDYFRAIARTPGGWHKARAGFEKLIADNPTDPRYRLALANHFTLKSESRVAGLQMLAELASRDDIRHDEVMTAWRRGLERSSGREATPAMLQAFAAFAPDDTEAQAWASAGHLPGRSASADATAPSPTPAQDPRALERERRLRQVLADGERQLKADQLPSALQSFGEARGLAPNSAPALSGQVQTLIRMKRLDQAEALISASKSDAPMRARLRADLLRAQSERARAAGHNGLALSLLERAQDQVPQDPWARYALAGFYADLGLQRQGRELMEEGLQMAPRDPDTRYAQALYLARIDADEAALSTLALIPPQQRSQGMRELQSRVELRQALARARQLHASQQQALAVRQLESVAGLAVQAAPARKSWIEAWADIGETDRALSLINAAMVPKPDSDLGLLKLRILDGARRDPDLLAAADASASLILTADQQRELQSRRVNALRRIVRARLDQADTSAALAIIDRELARAVDQRPLRVLRAEVLAEAGRSADAEQAYRLLLAEPGVEPELRLDAARVMEQNGRRAAAREQVDRVLASAPDDALELRLSAARRLRAQNDAKAADQVLQPLLKRFPQSASLHEEAGWLARGQSDYSRALDQFRAAQGLRPDDAGLAPVIQSIEDRRTGLFSAGVNFENRPGDPGLSDTRQWILPTEVRWPYRYDGHFVVQADTVHVEAGRLPGDYDNAALYGTVQAAGPASVLGFADGVEQQDSGLALGVGYENDRWRVDVGTTPVGFAVQDVVGGLRYEMPVSVFNLSMEVSRRAVLSSLLAFAGAKDPVSGRVWGGVRQNGGEVRLAYYGQRLSASLGAEAALFEGKNVPDNGYFGSRASADYALYRNGSQRLTLGVAAVYWDYQRNQRYYSFGHGGYFSPQSYLNFLVPLEWRGRIGRVSYELRASVSRASSREDSAAFYPNDPGLQSQAALSSLPPGYQQPVYGGSSGGAGWGRGLQARAEVPVVGPWALGLRVGLDRSDYYEPNFYTLYLRRSLKSGETTVLPPRPPRIYSEY